MYIQFTFLILLSISLIFIQSKYFFLVDRPENQQHKLAYNKGILFCAKCGCYTIKIVRGLKAACKMKPSCAQQQRGLNSLMLGQPPLEGSGSRHLVSC